MSFQIDRYIYIYRDGFCCISTEGLWVYLAILHPWKIDRVEHPTVCSSGNNIYLLDIFYGRGLMGKHMLAYIYIHICNHIYIYICALLFLILYII